MKKILWKLTLASLAALLFLPSAQAQDGAQEVEKITFRWGNTPIGDYTPSTLEIRFNQKWDEGELAGQYVVYRIDAATRDIVRNDGAVKGRINADGSFESPNLGTLQVDGQGRVWRGDEQIGTASKSACWCYDHKFGSFDAETNRGIVALVYLGLLCSENQVAQWKQEHEEAVEAASRVTYYEIRKNGGRGYVDSNGVVYDWSKTRIGQLPKGNGDIQDKYGSTIGTVSFGAEDIKDRSGKLLCSVKSSGTICDGAQPDVPYATIGIYGEVKVNENQKSLGECRCDNKTWIAILIYCDFFRF